MNWRAKVARGLIRTHELDKHLVREYSDRLAIWRKDGERLGWEEIQAVKQEIWGDRVAIELYPKQSDVVNLRHTRHLWSGPAIDDAAEVCAHEEFLP